MADLAAIKQRLAIGRVTMDDAEALVREVEHARMHISAAIEALGPAWLAGGVTLAEAITRKCRILELLPVTNEDVYPALEESAGPIAPTQTQLREAAMYDDYEAADV